MTAPLQGFTSGSAANNLPGMQESQDLVLIPGLGRFPAGGHDNSVHYS